MDDAGATFWSPSRSAVGGGARGTGDGRDCGDAEGDAGAAEISSGTHGGASEMQELRPDASPSAV
jgi:hypothetical protein